MKKETNEHLIRQCSLPLARRLKALGEDGPAALVGHPEPTCHPPRCRPLPPDFACSPARSLQMAPPRHQGHPRHCVPSLGRALLFGLAAGTAYS